MTAALYSIACMRDGESDIGTISTSAHRGTAHIHPPRFTSGVTLAPYDARSSSPPRLASFHERRCLPNRLSRVCVRPHSGQVMPSVADMSYQHLGQRRLPLARSRRNSDQTIEATPNTSNAHAAIDMTVSRSTGCSMSGLVLDTRTFMRGHRIISALRAFRKQSPEADLGEAA